MHWTTNIEENLKPKKAEKDIDTFKICRMNSFAKEAYPFHYPFQESFKKGILYGVDVNAVNPVGNCIYSGYKTYSASKDKYVMVDDAKLCVMNGTSVISYYGCRNTPPMSTIVMKCIVPKGATYYENEYGEIVSNQIKVASFLKVKDIK